MALSKTPPTAGSNNAYLAAEMAGEARNRADSDAFRQFEDGKLIHVPVDELDANTYQPRSWTNPQKVAELKAAILADGLLQPITVTKRMGSKRLMIVSGHTRHRVFSELLAEGHAQFATIPAVCKGGLDELHLASAGYVENAARADLNPVEEAAALATIRRLAEVGTPTEVAERVGQPAHRVRRLLKLHDDTPSFIQAAVRGVDIAPFLKLSDHDFAHKDFGALSVAASEEGAGEARGDKPMSEVTKDDKRHRHLDLLGALELGRLHEHYQKKDAKTAAKKAARVVVTALEEQWSLRRISEFVAAELKPKKKAKPAARPALFEETEARFSVNLKGMQKATAEELAELEIALLGLTEKLNTLREQRTSQPAAADGDESGED